MIFKDTQPYQPGLQTVTAPWSAIGLFPSPLFSQELTTSTRFSASATILSNRAAVTLTSRVFRRIKDRWNNYQSKEEANLLLALPHQQTLWTRASDESVKVYYHLPLDFLPTYLQGWEGYGSFFSTRLFRNSSFRVGAVRGWEQGWLDLRARFNVGQFKPESFLNCKAVFKGDRLQAGLLLAGSVEKGILQKNDVEVGVKVIEDHWVWATLYCENFRTYRINFSRLGSYFDLMKLAYVGKHKGLTGGLQLEYSVEDSESKNIEAAVEVKPRWDWLKWAKVKLNTHWELCMAGEVGLGESFRLKGSLYWFNIFKQAKPSHFSLRVTYN